MVNLLKRLIREDRGTAVLEAAVTFPLLMTLGFGAFEFSNAFFEHQEITTGVRDAARYFARLPVLNPGDNPCDLDQTAAKNLAVFGTIDATTPPRVPRIDKNNPGWTVGEVAIACTPVDNSALTYRGATTLYIIRVTATVPYPQLGFMTAIGLTAPTFTLTHFERWIGG